MDPLLNIAIKAARAASKVMLHNNERIDRLEIEKKGHADFVSEVDRQAEQMIIQIIQDAYPDHAILAEESGARGDVDQSEHQWIIDPLDGTTNYLHAYPVYAVSIAVKVKNELQSAVIYDPSRDELFSASKGKGAHLNNRRIRVSETRRLAEALLATGFPYKDMDYLDAWVQVFKSVAPHVSGVRRAGSAALDLAYVASGRFDGFWEFGLKPWDIAAGLLLIQEAGGFYCDVQGEQNMLETGHVITANPRLFGQIKTLVREHTKSLLQT